MKTKDLFKAIEAHNSIAERLETKRAFIGCMSIEDCNGFLVHLGVDNINRDDGRFYNWNEFAATIAYDFRKDVATLVAKGSLVETSKGVFILKDDEYCDGFAIKFFIYNN